MASNVFADLQWADAHPCMQKAQASLSAMALASLVGLR